MSADVLVLGAGVNGLTCAAMLAKAGRRVTVLERRDVAGGLAVGEEIEPGVRAEGVLHDTAGLRPEVVAELALEKHGLRLLDEPPPVLLPEADGPGVLLARDPERAAAEIGARSPEDAGAYREYRAFLGRIGVLADRLLAEAPPDPQRPDFLRLAGDGIAFRRLRRDDRAELLRAGPMCVADWLNERFRTPRLKSGLALPAVRGGFFGPWSPGTTGALLLHEAGTARAVAGGPRAVVAALEAAARSHGAEIRTGADVGRIRVDAGGVRGVTLADGEPLDARVVAASCDPRTVFLRLLRSGDVPAKLEHRIEAWRSRGTAAKVDLRLSAPLRFRGREDAAIARAFTGESVDEMERAFDAVKYRRVSDRPVLDVLADAEGRTVSIVAQFAPFEREGGWDDQARERLGDAVLGELERVAPGVRSAVTARRVLAPPDVGHLHHGDHALDQLFVRPSPECARYATPVRGLFLCGSGSWPGGGITGAPGRLASRAIRAAGQGGP